MFAYCGNNPSNNTDSSGNNWFKAIATKVLDAAETVVKKVQSLTSKANIVVSQGFSGNGSPGAFDFVQSGVISVDAKGNVAVQYQPFTGGMTTNTSWSASFCATTSITFAPTLNELEGPGYSVGGSLFTQYYGLGGGFDVNIAETKKRSYLGFTASAGVGVPSGEVHVNWGETRTIPASQINIYNEIYKRIDLLRSWCLQ